MSDKKEKIYEGIALPPNGYQPKSRTENPKGPPKDGSLKPVPAEKRQSSSQEK